jgi:hypothetical protein
MPCRLAKVNRHCLYLQGRRVNRANSQQEAGAGNALYRHRCEDLKYKIILGFLNYIVTISGCDYRRGMDWRLDLLTQLGTTSNYSAIGDFYTFQITRTR